MKGSEFVKLLPEGKTLAQMAKREQMLLDAVRRREIAPIAWAPVTTSCNGNTATFLVSTDALRIGDALDSVRISASHRLAQRIADELGCVLPTPLLSDEIWAQASLKIPPLPHLSWTSGEGDGTMMQTQRMVQQSKLVDQLIADARKQTGEEGLVADVGKDWVNTKLHQTEYGKDCGQPWCGINYGWHWPGLPVKAKTAAGQELYQGPGSRHVIDYTDYSQVVRLIRRDVEGCSGGQCWTKDIDDIARDPSLSCLVSHEGPLSGMRHPGLAPACDPSIRCASAGQGYRASQLLAPAICADECIDLPPPELPPKTPDKPTKIATPAVWPVAIATGVAGFLAARWLLSR